MKTKLPLGQELWIAIKYGMVGILNTLVFTLSVYMLSMTNFSYMQYTAAGYCIAITFSFFMNMKFTFSRFPGAVFSRAVKFLITALSLMLIAQVVQYVLIEYAGLEKPIGIVIGMIVYTTAGFLINRLWVFK